MTKLTATHLYENYKPERYTFIESHLEGVILDAPACPQKMSSILVKSKQVPCLNCAFGATVCLDGGISKWVDCFYISACNDTKLNEKENQDDLQEE